MITITATVSEIRSNRAGPVSDAARITADYESAGILGSIPFVTPIEEARTYWVGQELTIAISPQTLDKGEGSRLT